MTSSQTLLKIFTTIFPNDIKDFFYKVCIILKSDSHLPRKFFLLASMKALKNNKNDEKLWNDFLLV